MGSETPSQHHSSVERKYVPALPARPVENRLDPVSSLLEPKPSGWRQPPGKRVKHWEEAWVVCESPA